jgi:hypothetical protein
MLLRHSIWGLVTTLMPYWRALSRISPPFGPHVPIRLVGFWNVAMVRTAFNVSLSMFLGVWRNSGLSELTVRGDDSFSASDNEMGISLQPQGISCQGLRLERVPRTGSPIHPVIWYVYLKFLFVSSRGPFCQPSRSSFGKIRLGHGIDMPPRTSVWMSRALLLPRYARRVIPGRGA